MKKFTPTLFVFFTLLGLIAGIYISQSKGSTIIVSTPGSTKIDELANLMRYNYVDTLDVDKVIEKAMPKVKIYLEAKMK